MNYALELSDMSRIRSVHPGFFTDEAYVSMSPLARLFCIGVWNECDDQGVFEWKPLQLKMRLLPADNVSVADLLKEMLRADVARQFSVNGFNYGVIRNFQQYQRPKKPNSVHPLPSEFRTYVQGKRSSSEPEDDDGGSGSPPTSSDVDTSSPPVPHRRQNNVAEFPSGSRKSSQMEDGGGREGGKEEDRSLRSLPRRQAVEDEFSAFWQAYPRKVGKDSARKAYAAARKRAGVADIADGLNHQRWPDDPRFIPHPATWLNQGRWQDDPGAAAPVQRNSMDAVREDWNLPGLAWATEGGTLQ